MILSYFNIYSTSIFALLWRHSYYFYNTCITYDIKQNTKNIHILILPILYY